MIHTNGTTRGAYDELVQIEEVKALTDAASERDYKNGYAAKRRARNKKARNRHELVVMENKAAAAEHPSHATRPNWMNPLWWVAGALVVMAFRRK
jgi:hypothetical protein